MRGNGHRSLPRRLWRRVAPDPAPSDFVLPIQRRGLGRLARSRILCLRLAVLAWITLVICRLVDLQVLQSDRFKRTALRQHEATIDIPARRGGILDRNGRDLALSTPAQSVGVFADQVPDRRALARRLAPALDVDESALRRRLDQGGFQWAKRLVTLAEAQRARDLDLDVLHFETESKRYYPHATVAAHLLGTVGLDHQGQAGLEQRFEWALRGDSGQRLMQYDAHQQRYGMQVLKPSVPGDDLILEIDLDLQSIVEMELERSIRQTRSQAGTVVLMEPSSGAVVAMSSWPRFDPNSLSRTPEDLENTRNFAVSYLVEPGSTFKVLTAAAALEEGVVTVADEFDCEQGAIWVGRRRIRDHHPYGILTMPQVLIKSSNVGIIKVGQRLGKQSLHKYIRRFGFGSATGVPLPGEVSGLVRPLARWSGNSLESLSMGQEIGVTALQMARLFAAVANGGMLVKPRIIRAIRKHEGPEVAVPPEQAERVMGPGTAATIQAILEQVVEVGTGRRARIPDYRVAGKTGTAQMINPVSKSYSDGAYLASFCGFAPVNRAALVGVVMLYDPRGELYYGGSIAAPLFQAVMRRALRSLDVPPLRALPSQSEPVVPVPDLLLADFVEDEREDRGGWGLAVPAVDALSVRPFEVNGPAGHLPFRSDRPAHHPESGSPEPDVLPGPGATHGIDVSLAREPATGAGSVPDMLGMTMREAVVLAARRGIEIETTGSGLVLLQTPAPSEPLSAGQTLQLHFGLSPFASDPGTAPKGRGT